MPSRPRRSPRRPAIHEAARSSPPPEGEKLPSTWLTRHGPLVAVCVVLVLVALVRLRVADLPLERDEGEYAYAGAADPARDPAVPARVLAYNMKFPGTYYAYAVMPHERRAVHRQALAGH